MRKLILLFTLVFISVQISLSQINAYTFSSFTGTYTPVSAGTQLIAAGIDDGNSAATNIGFDFVYNGTTFTQFVANSNGHIRLGGVMATSNYYPISSTTNTNAISVIGRDGRTGGAVVYELTGTAPNRVLTIEYPAFNLTYSLTTSYVDAQIKLYETSNVVEFVYNNAAATSSYFPEIGLRGTSGATDFNNRTTTTDWSNTTAGANSAATMTFSPTVLPANGLTFRWTPPSCPAPAGLTATNITTTSARLEWTGSAALGFQVEWGTAPLTQGTGTIDITTNNYYDLSSLSASTQYTFYVRAICAVGDTSDWAGPYSFATLCNSVTTFPFTESFEGTTFAPICWTNIKTAGGGTPGIWDRQTSGTYPTCAPQDGAAMARYNAFNLSSGTTGILVTPQITFPGDNYQVSFWMYRDAGYPTTTDLVNVHYNTTPNTTGSTLLGTINRSYTLTPIEVAEGWYQYTFSVPAGTSGNAYIVFEAVSAYGNNIFIDNILIDVVPSCLAPTALTATGITQTAATLEWTSPAPEFQVEWGLEDFTLGTGTFATTTNTTYPLSGLTAATVYDFYVRAICGVGDTSSWAGPYTFATSCPTTAYTLPFFEDFEGVVCWSVWNEDAGGVNWQLATNQNHTPGGSVAAVHNYGAVGYDESGWIFTPDIILPAGGTYELLFWSYTEFATYYGNSAVIVSTDDFVTYDTIWSPTSVSGNVWTPVALDLSSYGGNTISVAFRYQGNDGHRWWIDDVLVQEIIGAEINPVAADYDLTYPADVKTTITWNDASSIVTIVDDQTIPYTLIENTDYEILDDTLFVYDSYLATLLTIAGNSVDLTISFDAGADAVFVITAIETVLVDATINPVTADYDLTTPVDVSTTITWNDATSITSIIDDQGTPYTLIENTDYTLSGNTLTILDSYLANILLASGDDVVLTITFDQGVALFTINAIQTVLVEVIAHWDFEDITKRDAITSNALFNSNPYTADNGIVANVDIAPITLVGAPLFTAWVAGSGGAGTFAPNANTWDNGMDTKYWLINFSTSGYENLKLSSKQRASATGPRDFNVQYSTDGLSWTDVPGSTIVDSVDWTHGVLNELELPVACNNQPTLMLRWIMTTNTAVNLAAVASTGTIRIDDILITGTDVTVSVPEFTSDVNVYPNPSNGQFVIESNDNWVMMVFDITGRMIASDYLNKGSNDINLLNQPAGLYLIKLMNENQTQTLRIVIE
jgi:hypothetical protein